MTYQPQKIEAPDGTALVIITEAEYRALCEARDDAADLAAAFDALKAMQDDGAIPADVSRAIRSGVNPVTAWRKHRGLTQAALAAQCGLTQPAIARIERSQAGAGSSATLARLAEVFDAPEWALRGRH